MGHKDPAARAAYQRAYRERNKTALVEYQRQRRLTRRYGINLEQYDALFKDQGGVCALCGQPPSEGTRLHVDHDHACCPGGDARDTNEDACGNCVRGLLCHQCNTALGTLGDTVDSIERVLGYLKGGRLGRVRETPC